LNAAHRARLLAERSKPVPDRKYRLWCRDAWREFDVFRVPVEALLLNVDNRRFTAERKLVEDSIGHTLDPEANPADEQVVISILLDEDPQKLLDGGTPKATADTLSLEADWRARSQETPFWVRPDGTVRNGNRRLAVIKRLQSRVGEEGNEWVDAVILDPADIDERELFKMEQREQLTENFKVRYTDINLLLALRDAAIQEDVDWADPQDLDRVAGMLQRVAGGDKAYAIIQLQAIRYMDAYLKDLNADGQYHKLFRRVERFRDVGKNMARLQEEFPDEAADLLRLQFAAIRSDLPHDDIRSLRNIFLRERGRYDELLAKVTAEEEAWEQRTEPQLLDPQIGRAEPESEAEAEADESEESEESGPVLVDYPRREVSELVKNAIDAHRAATMDARNQLIQAWGRLEQITETRLVEALKEADGEARRTLSDIVEWSERAKPLLR
jgi:hypothetical protein